MPCLKRCCCCVTLRMGGITMGLMTLALSLFSSIVMALAFVSRENLAGVVVRLMRKYSEEEEDGNPPDGTAFWGAVSRVLTTGSAAENEARMSEEDEKRADWLEGVMYIFFITCLVLLLLYLICSALLIYSAARGRHRWAMMPWILITFLCLVAYLVGVFLTIGIFGGRLEILLLIAFAIVETAIGFYLWLCVISLFQVLGSNEWRNGNGNSDWEMKPRFTTTYNSVPTQD